MIDLWYKNAVFYCIDVETYMDANGDGIGDFEGLTQRIDYLAGLGVSCIWLMPFYPTPNKDNGYDVMDYYNVDARLGTLGDFVEFTRQAQERGMRIIIDLVVNHTSDQHPWFQAACQDKNSKYRDYYIWSEEKPEDAEEGIIFPGVQKSTWTYNETAGAYYAHRFYDHQADLNIVNPAVRKEIEKIMGFWLALGVSGFRVDAAPFLIEIMKDEHKPDVADPFIYIKEMRDFLSWRRGDAILLAEANVSESDLLNYVGDGDMMQMLFSFFGNQYLFLALAREQVEPLRYGLGLLPSLPMTAQWANFVRNHDELSLDKLSKSEQDEIAAQFAPDRDNMWIYDRGVRRRFAPMMDGDQRRIRLAYSLMFTLPGSPVLNFGEEIGMGDDLSLKERNSARTPMQWSDQKNGGFSNAPADQLILPVVSEGEFSYKKVNVINQRRNPDSLLNWMERIIRMRKECPEFGWGECHLLETGNPSVFAHRCDWENGTVIAIHNLSHVPCKITLDIKDDDADRLIDLLGDHEYAAIADNSHEVELESYGYRWFRVGDYHL
jgi:maltose alpha-D-glucosyltransferase / alpha-amylase